MLSFDSIKDINTVGAGVVIAILGLYALYRCLLPKPIPGIPYNETATASLLGDIPEIVEVLKTDASWGDWMISQIEKHNSPLCQIFMSFPFYKPAVILADVHEAQDVFIRRTKEFDRSSFLTDLFGGLLSNHHILLHTNEKFKSQRRLLQDLMTPSFLRGVASGVIYDKASHLVRLWEIKMEVANGRPFSVLQDMYHAAMDAVLGFSFGGEFGYGAIEPKIKHLSRLSREEKNQMFASGGKDDPLDFPSVELEEEITATIELSAGVEKMYGALWPSLVWWVMEQTSLRKAASVKKRFIRQQLEVAASRLERTDEKGDESWFRSAVDLVVSREKRFAEKDGRKPDYTSKMIQSEIFGFIIGGHDTTSTTMLWSLKNLTKHPEIQTKLRNVLREAFPKALAESRLPTNSEIHDTNIPYLDATIEELIRISCTVPFTTRDTMQDTVLLGHLIPKGTTVFICGTGPGSLMPPLDIDETKRSESSRNAKTRSKTGVWDTKDIASFKPERWLTPPEDSEKGVEFDSSAGPNLTFGLGVRGCFGRRLAYLEMKTLLTLIVWRFILEPTPMQLSGHAAVDGVTHKPKQAYVRLRASY